MRITGRDYTDPDLIAPWDEAHPDYESEDEEAARDAEESDRGDRKRKECE